jgi:hypothetical protein
VGTGRRNGISRAALAAAALSLVLAGCSGGGGGGAGETTGGSAAGTTGPGSTEPGPDTTAAGETTVPVLTTVLVGVVVGGNSGGVGERNTDDLSETVRTSDTECRGWFGSGPAPEPWTSGLQRGAVVRVVDDAGQLLGTGTLGAGRPRNVTPDDGERWQCEFAFSIDGVVTASSYHLEIAGLAPVTAEGNPFEPGTYVVPVDTPLEPGLVEDCSNQDAQGVSEWNQTVGEYWSRGLSDLCAAGLRIRRIRRQCRPAGLATLQVLSVLGTDGKVFEDAGSHGPKVDPDTLASGTQVDVTVTTPVPCG